MTVSIIAVGKPGPLASAIRGYERRAEHYWRFEVAELRASRGKDAAEVRRREAELLRARIDPRFRCVATTRCGARTSSVDLARWLGDLALRSARGVHFLIGGAYGLDRVLIGECTRTLSLSAMTLPRDMARLVLAEQLYRAGTILRNEPYHKGRT